jgi:hypothetical protein
VPIHALPLESKAIEVTKYPFNIFWPKIVDGFPGFLRISEDFSHETKNVAIISK